MTSNWQVIIAGAGPTGLTLAAELAGAGIRCLVVERRAEASPHSRAFTMMSYTMELLDMRGQADAMVEHGLPCRYAPFGDGKRYLDFGRLDSRFPYLLLLPQHDTEVILEKWAIECGATVLREARVTGLQQDENSVAVQIEHKGNIRDEHALYAVGCDGVHSAVRDLVGIPFPGKSYDCSLIIADVHLDHPPDPAVHARISKRGMAAVFPFPKSLFRLIILDHERMHVPLSEPVTLLEIQESAKALLGTDIGIRDPIWLSRFRSEQRQAVQYRKGRVLLAGDAAHTHIPSGGQGLQIGIQDGFNLGWKLAAHIQGWAPGDLLDSYQKERYPIATETLRQTDINFRYETSQSYWLNTLRRLAMQLMRLKGVQKSIINNFAGFKLRYRPLKGRSSHSMVGRRIPEIVITGAQNRTVEIHELLRRRQFVLFDQSDDGMFAAQIGNRWSDRLCVIRGKASNRRGLPQGLLVRPDGIVAWATSKRKAAGLEVALLQWCGNPRSATPSIARDALHDVKSPENISSGVLS
jgi:2-polyprenyl-6-methoxyphenol hydroxylase-like FAD-dependent oxidoreductase